MAPGNLSLVVQGHLDWLIRRVWLGPGEPHTFLIASPGCRMPGPVTHRTQRDAHIVADPEPR